MSQHEKGGRCESARVFTRDETATLPKLAFSIPEAVAATSLSRTGLYAALASGRLTARKVGARTLIDVAELRRFIAELPPFVPLDPARCTSAQPAPTTARAHLPEATVARSADSDAGASGEQSPVASRPAHRRCADTAAKPRP